jgi:hypothetical protein
MEKDSEVFVAFDAAKKKHAVAIAEGGRTGEVRSALATSPKFIVTVAVAEPADGVAVALRPAASPTRSPLPLPKVITLWLMVPPEVALAAAVPGDVAVAVAEPKAPTRSSLPLPKVMKS